jgi:hypothetical protein
MRSVSVPAGTRHVATPLPLTGTLTHKDAPVVLFTKFTTPVFTVELLVVVDVSVIAWFVNEGFADDANVVVVEDAAGVVTISRDQPPATVLVPPPAALS